MNTYPSRPACTRTYLYFPSEATRATTGWFVLFALEASCRLVRPMQRNPCIFQPGRPLEIWLVARSSSIQREASHRRPPLFLTDPRWWDQLMEETWPGTSIWYERAPSTYHVTTVRNTHACLLQCKLRPSLLACQKTVTRKLTNVQAHPPFRDRLEKKETSRSRTRRVGARYVAASY